MKRLITAVLTTVFILAFAASAEEGSVEVTPGERPFVHMGELDSTLITPESWYLEERDSLGRPVRATEWRKGEISLLTSWVYEGENQKPSLMLSTDSRGSTESRYDGAGLEVNRVVQDPSGKILTEIRREWDSQGRETLRETREKGNETLERWVYDDEGELRERVVERDGQKVFSVIYETDGLWSENIYRNGILILSERYVNGSRETLQ